MRIVVNEIPRNGLIFEEVKTSNDLDVGRDGITFNEPVKIKVFVFREYNNVHIKMEIIGSILVVCGRCLAEVKSNINKKFEIIKPVSEEKVIDLTQIAREEIILDYPGKILCKSGCKGLCYICGKNLNKGNCDCKRNGSGSWIRLSM